jgi:hypothetical protein
MRAPALAAAAAAFVVLAAGTASFAQAGSASLTLAVKGSVESISASGRRVAIHVDSGDSCGTGSIWTPSSGSVIGLPDCGSSDALLSDLTLAGDTAIWWDWSSGNHVYCDDVYTATVADPKPHALGICDGTMADDYFGFAGDRTLVAIDDYSVCQSDCVGPQGGLLPDGDYGVQVRRLRGGGKPATVLPGRDLRKFLDARNRRVAVIEPKATLAVYDAGGKLLWQVPGVSGVESGWIAGASVVVQRGRSVQVYSAHSGVIPARTLPKGAHLADVAGGLVVYTIGSSVHLLRLSDGRDGRIVTVKGLAGAQLTPAGVFYAANVANKGGRRGLVTFVPIRMALQLLR